MSQKIVIIIKPILHRRQVYSCWKIYSLIATKKYKLYFRVVNTKAAKLTDYIFEPNFKLFANLQLLFWLYMTLNMTLNKLACFQNSSSERFVFFTFKFRFGRMFMVIMLWLHLLIPILNQFRTRYNTIHTLMSYFNDTSYILTNYYECVEY